MRITVERTIQRGPIDVRQNDYILTAISTGIMMQNVPMYIYILRKVMHHTISNVISSLFAILAESSTRPTIR